MERVSLVVFSLLICLCAGSGGVLYAVDKPTNTLLTVTPSPFSTSVVGPPVSQPLSSFWWQPAADNIRSVIYITTSCQDHRQCLWGVSLHTGALVTFGNSATSIPFGSSTPNDTDSQLAVSIQVDSNTGYVYVINSLKMGPWWTGASTEVYEINPATASVSLLNTIRVTIPSASVFDQANGMLYVQYTASGYYVYITPIKISSGRQMSRYEFNVNGKFFFDTVKNKIVVFRCDGLGYNQTTGEYVSFVSTLYSANPQTGNYTTITLPSALSAYWVGPVGFDFVSRIGYATAKDNSQAQYFFSFNIDTGAVIQKFTPFSTAVASYIWVPNP